MKQKQPKTFNQPKVYTHMTILIEHIGHFSYDMAKNVTLGPTREIANSQRLSFHS